MSTQPEALHLADALEELDQSFKEARKSIGAGVYTERKKAKGEALKQQFDWRHTTYRSGDGDHTAQVPRAGSMDAYSLPSRGNRT